MRKTLVTLLVCSMSLIASAQTSLKGTLIDEATSQPIVGATITLANQNISTTTNQSGEFSLLYLEAGDEEVIIEAEDYNGTIELVQLHADQANQMDPIKLSVDVDKETKDEILINIADEDLNDDEGKSQAQASAASASTDVFNSATSFAWGTARYRNRGYEQHYETVYINGVSFNTAERGTFSFSAMGGLNDASRNREVVLPLEATNFTFGNLGQSTNYLMNASRFAQGWKVSVAGTNRNYKAALRATYATGPLKNGWSVIAQLAFRFSPYTTQKGIIGEGINYYSLGYFVSAEKVWDNGNRLSITTFGAPTMRGQNAAVTQEVYDLTGTNNYNPYWGYQDGHIRNSRIVKSFDPTAIVSYDLKLGDFNILKFAVGYHYSMYSNSAINFYNAPDPRPDYYRNLPSFYWDGQIVNGNSSQLYDYSTGEHYPWGSFIGNDLNGVPMGSGFVGKDGNTVGPSIDAKSYNTLVDLWKNRDDKTTQIDWDALYAANYADPDGLARYMVERRHNDIQEAMANVLWTNNKFDHLKMTLGVEGKFSEGIHYKTMDDLLGADHWIDIDPFADRDIKELATNIGMSQSEMNLVKQNDLANPQASIKNGQLFGYNYRMNISQEKVWFQNEWNFNEIDFYYAIQGTYTYMQRSTDMINGRAWYLAVLNPESADLYLGNAANDILAGKFTSGRKYGKSHYFVDPAFKLGFTYKINGRNKLKFNAIAETRAPLARNAYISQRVHDRVLSTIYTHDKAKTLQDYFAASEMIAGGDLTYEFNYRAVRGRITGYYTRFWNGSELNGFYDDEARTFVNQAISGIDRRHCGVEAAIAVKLGTYFTLTGVAAVGDHRYTSNALAVTSAENGMALATNMLDKSNIYEVVDSVMYKGLRVSTGPQVNASLKLSFFHPKMWFADITVSYYDWNFLSVAPSRRMMGLYTGVRADGSLVNGSYKEVYSDHDNYFDARVMDPETGEPYRDQYGNYQLQYPYNQLDKQESLSATNPLNRFMIDFSVGKVIYLKNRQSLNINLMVSNIGHNLNFKTGGYQQARLPRSTRQQIPDGENSTINANAWKFPAKYYYAWGPNLYATITYKF
ncbi:MAG: carboxypeptidase regulatory-like domain-containing protein [Paludibacteraceae bacterium]|nr:carboxypeptidase regulatory-like domain-containing protein [Paludibacteraceae bacterium]